MNTNKIQNIQLNIKKIQNIQLECFNRCSHNEYMLSYLLSQASLRKRRKYGNTKEEPSEEDLQLVPNEEDMQDLFDEDIGF